MLLFRQSPLLRILVPFSLGIVSSGNEPLQIRLLIPFFAVLLIYIILFAVRSGYRYRWAHSFISILLFYLTGSITASLHNDNNMPWHFSHFKQDFLIVRLLEPPVHAAKTVKVKAEAECMQYNDSLRIVNGKMILYFRDSIADLEYGDVLLIKGNYSTIKGPANPDEFNYAAFLALQNIRQQIFVDHNSWKLLYKEPAGVFSFAYHLRDKLVDILRDAITDKNIYSVASALLVGYEEDLSRDLMTAYASSGTLHVLSVSGMHVAIIYKVLERLLAFLFRIKRGRHLFFLIMLVTMWFYALLSGLSPSVVRATMMISLVMAGKWAGRSSAIINTITVSCLFLIAYNPSLIYEPGFRLSLLAVLGIVLIHPLIFRMYTPSGKIMYALWSIISVSFSAQLITLPVSLYYFHQFPMLFLFSNLLIIPATTLAIYSGIALVFIYKIPVAGMVAARVTYASVWFANKTAELIYSLPFAAVEGIYITAFEAWLLYIIIIIACFYLLRRQAVYLKALLIVISLFSTLSIAENIYIARQESVVVYSIRDHATLNLISGRRNYFLADTSLLADTFRLNFHVRQHWWRRGLEPPQHPGNLFEDHYLFRKDNFIRFGGTKIIIADSLFCSKLHGDGKNKFLADYVILSKNPSVTVHELLQLFSFTTLIIDSSNRKRNCLKWVNQAGEAHVRVYDVNSSGAFVAYVR